MLRYPNHNLFLYLRLHYDFLKNNIVVSPSGQPLLCDFGISFMILSSQTLTSTTGGFTGSLPWTSPELLENTTKHTVESDVWAFGMTIYVSTYADMYMQREIRFYIYHVLLTGIFSKRGTICKRAWRNANHQNDHKRHQTHTHLYRPRSPSQEQMGQPLRRRKRASQPRRPTFHGSQRDPSLEPLQEIAVAPNPSDCLLFPLASEQRLVGNQG